MDPVTSIIVASIGAFFGLVGVIVTSVLIFRTNRRSNDLKAVELEQAQLRSDQEREAAKRQEASAKHQRDMERVAALEARHEEMNQALDRMRGKYARLFEHALALMQHINDGKPPPPPQFPMGLLD